MKITQRCTKCGNVKERNEENFRIQAASRSGFHPWCRVCHDESSKENYQKNKDRKLKQVKIWQSKNKNKVKRYKQTWINKNKKS